MRPHVLKLVALAALMTALAACNRNSGETASGTAAPAEQVAQAPAPAPEAPAIAPGTELPVNEVSSAMLSRPPDAPDALLIHVTGMANSAGWTDAKLAPDSEPSEDKDVATYRLVATSPKKGEAAATSPELDVELRVDAFPAGIKTVKIVSATNEISLPVTQ